MARNIYISFPGTDPLKGDALGKEVDGKNCIEILDVSNGLHMPISGASPGHQSRLHGRAEFQDLSFSKYADSASPHLVSFCAGGNIIKTAIIQHFTASQKDASSTPILAYQITLTNVIITSYSLSGSGHDLPVENITLNYSQIEWQRKEMDNKSTAKAPAAVTTGWNLEKNVKK
jgi:type VI secretion system secreted protein Hcp